MKKKSLKKTIDSSKHFMFEAIYLGNTRYFSPGYVSINSKGIISYLSDKKPRTEVKINKFQGLLLPGFINSHSHAFQRSMAGKCEFTTKKELGKDDFWTWRNKMYEISAKQNPESILSSYTKHFSEMLKNGFTHIVEFHYLHGINEKNPDKSLSFEMSQAIAEAATKAGIGLTLVPVLYQRGGVKKESNSFQKKFSFKNLEAYVTFYDKIHSLFKSSFPEFILGSGVHSLRAVEASDVKEILTSKLFSGPKHIHVAEQEAEVAEIMQHYGKRPVEWLQENQCLDQNTNLVHATHILPSEMNSILESNATVVLCPSTEANLGDGFFPMERFKESSGRWSIGTDSHINLNFFEELRWLDYGCRLRLKKRLSLASIKYLRPAEYMIDTSILCGRSSAGISKSKDLFNLGDSFSGVMCNPNSDLFHTASPEHKLSFLVYSADSSAITHIFNKNLVQVIS